jgi:hypothetical protein
VIRRLIGCFVAVVIVAIFLPQLVGAPLRWLLGTRGSGVALGYAVLPVASLAAVAASAWVAGVRTAGRLILATILGCVMAGTLIGFGLWTVSAVGRRWDILSLTTVLINAWHVEYVVFALALVIPAFLAAHLVSSPDRRRATVV